MTVQLFHFSTVLKTWIPIVTTAWEVVSFYLLQVLVWFTVANSLSSVDFSCHAFVVFSVTSVQFRYFCNVENCTQNILELESPAHGCLLPSLTLSGYIVVHPVSHTLLISFVWEIHYLRSLWVWPFTFDCSKWVQMITSEEIPSRHYGDIEFMRPIPCFLTTLTFDHLGHICLKHDVLPGKIHHVFLLPTKGFWKIWMDDKTKHFYLF